MVKTFNCTRFTRAVSPRTKHLHISSQKRHFQTNCVCCAFIKRVGRNRFIKIYLYLDAKTHNLKQYCSIGEEYWFLLVECLTVWLVLSSPLWSSRGKQLSTENKIKAFQSSVSDIIRGFSCLSQSCVPGKYFNIFHFGSFNFLVCLMFSNWLKFC